MTMRENTEVVVVGGGVSGAAITYYLSKEGIDVTLVEGGDIATGTSGGCEGNIMAEDHEPGFDSNMTMESNKLYQELVKELDYDFQYHQPGCFFLIESEKEWDFMKARRQKLEEAGLAVSMLDVSELRKREINVASDIVGALESAFCGSVQPMYLALALVEGAKKFGARIKTFSEVMNIRLAKCSKIASVITSQGEIRTSKVVNAAGAWAPQIGRMVGIDIPIVPRRGQLLVTEQIAPITCRKMTEARYIAAKFDPKLASDTDEDLLKYGVAFTFEPRTDGNILIGSSREFVGYDTRTSYPVIKAILKRATRFLPLLKSIHIIRTYGGVRPYTSDHLAIISPVDEVEGFYIAAGHEGDGIGLAPLTGKLISQLITGKPTTIPVERLRFSRFAKKQK
jgi:sarcosine oxidase subunit beta